MNPCLALLAVAALMPLAAHAQPKEQYTYRCTGKDGKKYYGQTIPQACLGMPLELINKQGLVVKRIDPEGDEKARLAKEAELEKKREMERAQLDTQRRNRALLATYTSEKDIEEARQRALRENQKQAQELEGQVDGLRKRIERSSKELESKAGGKEVKLIERLKDEINVAQLDLKAKETLLTAKKKEVEGINARYDEDRKRYKEAVSRK